MTTIHSVFVLILLLGAIQGGWLAFDGIRALRCGDYLTPRSGPHAGQLGPCARVVAALGFDPRSTAIKSLHVGLGVAWLTSATCFALHLSGSTWMLLSCALGTLWYVPLGTVLSLVLITILVLSKTGILP